MTDARETLGRDLLRHRDGNPVVAPSILAADFAHLADECGDAIREGADLLHLDVMDGHFVPNLTMGPALCESLRNALPTACLDVHLMITDPAAFAEPFAKAGADHITFHAEVVQEAEARRLADRIRELGCTAGIAINPGTPLERVSGWLDAFEMLLVMSVNPGFGGQGFIGEVVDKTRAARLGPAAEIWIEMDGGLSPANASLVVEAGCDVLVAGSAFFGRPRSEWSAIAGSMRGLH